ncbi:MAG TPA: anion permease, partial [Thermoanaerobaculaceae bacterium]|nr:anion permease [Thermoanaerobaculaceae bacterium]
MASSDVPDPHGQGGLSTAEQRFERVRRTLGLVAGPLATLTLLAFPLAGLSAPAARLAGVLSWVVVWWICEPVPLPVTAVLGPALMVILGVVKPKAAFAPFGDPVIFLFLGGFLLAEAMSVRRERAVLLSSDKDLMQLVNENILMLRPTGKGLDALRRCDAAFGAAEGEVLFDDRCP